MQPSFLSRRSMNLDPDDDSLVALVDFNSTDTSQLQYEPPPTPFVINFPSWLNKICAPLDDTLITLCQKLSSPIWKYICMAFTFAVAIEIMMALPIALFLMGYDDLATEVLYLGILTATISQVPKRFMWRYRPWMVNRADTRKRTSTSSFPSRAALCAVIASRIIVLTINYARNDFRHHWWDLVLYIVFPLIVAFARINLGVHYPSDCIAGFLVGIIVCLTEWGLMIVTSKGCGSCYIAKCYADPSDPSTLINVHTLSRGNYLLGGLFFLGSFIVGILFIVKPIKFWTKFVGVYGLLLPCVGFRLLFLCPGHNKHHAALQQPSAASKHWYIYFGATLLSLSLLFGAWKLGKKIPVLTFVAFYVVVMLILGSWRLFLMAPVT